MRAEQVRCLQKRSVLWADYGIAVARVSSDSAGKGHVQPPERATVDGNDSFIEMQLQAGEYSVSIPLPWESVWQMLLRSYSQEKGGQQVNLKPPFRFELTRSDLHETRYLKRVGLALANHALGKLRSNMSQWRVYQKFMACSSHGQNLSKVVEDYDVLKPEDWTVAGIRIPALSPKLAREVGEVAFEFGIDKREYIHFINLLFLAKS